MATLLNDVLRAGEALKDAEEALATAKAKKKRAQDEIDGINLDLPALIQRVSDAKIAFKIAVDAY